MSFLTSRLPLAIAAMTGFLWTIREREAAHLRAELMSQEFRYRHLANEAMVAAGMLRVGSAAARAAQDNQTAERLNEAALHLEVQIPPEYRKDYLLVRLPDPISSPPQHLRLASSSLPEDREQ